MKRVLFLTYYASPYRVNFFELLGKRCNLTVLLSDAPEEAVHRDGSWFGQCKGGFQMVQLKKTARIGEDRLCLEVVSWLKKPYDEIVICGYSSPTAMLAMSWLRLRGIPFWMEVDGGMVRQEGKAKYLFKRHLVSMASGWLSSGPKTSEYLIYYGARADRIFLYPFSSLYQADILPEPTPMAEKMALRRELAMAEDYIVLATGQFIHRKGFDILMRGAALLPGNVGIYIVGGEAPKEYLEERARLGLTNVHFLGFQQKRELARLFRAADLFVLPTRYDIWGLVVSEAMAYGLPVVTTDRCVAGLELVENGVNGYIVPIEDPAALAEKIQRTLDADRMEMGRASLKKIQPYTLENMAKTHMEIFESGRK